MIFKSEKTLNGAAFVLFSEVLEAAMLGDAKTANEKCRIEPAINVGPMPGEDQRLRYISKVDIPVLLARYTRLNSEQSNAIARITSTISPDISTDHTPSILPDMPVKIRGKKHATPDNGNKPLESFEKRWWNTWGNTLGNIYRSPLLLYMAFTSMVVALAFLHTTAAWRLLPGLPWWDMPVLAVLMQSIILVGTFNAHHFFSEARSYYFFLGGFAIYDLIMSACNFFQGYDPALLSSTGNQLVAAIIDLAIRIALSFGFTIGTLFFALLVKKVRAN